MVVELKTKQEFDDCLKNAGSKLVVVDFTAVWCGPCQKIKPEFEKFADEHKDAVFVKVDVDDNNETAAACDITSMPTFVFYKNGQKVFQFSGAAADKLKAAIVDHI